MVTLGIIGAGIMGERLLRAAQGQDAVHVTAVWDPDRAALDRLAAALPGTPVCATAADAIAACDCVYVASPPATHLHHARAALAANRALFCEKPLAVDTADAAAFLREATQARAAVNFPFASSPAVGRFAEWVATSQAEAVAIDVAFATWPRGWQHGAAGWLDGPAQGGFVREVVSHFLFLARRLFGPLALHGASTTFPEPGRSERAVQAHLAAGGIPVTLTGAVGTVADDDRNSFTVTGAAGTIRLRNWGLAERLADGTWHPDPAALPNDRARPLTLQRQLEGVAHMTRGEPHHLATLGEAYDVQTLVEAILHR